VNKFCKPKADGNVSKSMFVGMDVHKYYLQVAVLDEKGKVLNNSRVDNNLIKEATSVYSATKAAILSFARCWTVNLKHRKIRVNAISPGQINTSMTRSMVQGENGEQFSLFVLHNNDLVSQVVRPSLVVKITSLFYNLSQATHFLYIIKFVSFLYTLA
jgi:NAD(P)-dependent dehydrogenase (short-subunit alcohol dehydrogenase family)